ncbi:MAG: fibronectin type III domain-containing protein [Methanomassiliicoccus sp.]|nr:fibronectin type III domain-containing protein [Methanomassiliicoccus sp.]
MKLIHRCVSIALVLIVILSLCISIVVFLPDVIKAEQDGDYSFTVSDGNATITAYTGDGGVITIPSTLGGYPVTTIGTSAFSLGYSITSLTIPNSVTTLEYEAFSGCTSLTSVVIPGSVTSIWRGTFMGCPSLTSVTLSEGVRSIPDQMFYGCHALTSVTIPSTVELIGEYAFLECSSLTTLTIPEGVTSILPFAFQYSGLTSLTIPGTVESVGWYEFTDCSALTSLTFSEGFKSIGPQEPFSGCTSLTTVNIPSSLTSISAYGFQGCPSLTSINVDEDNPAYTSIDGVLYDKAATELILCPWAMKSATIPASVTSIGEYAFGECKALTSITFLGLEAPTNVGPGWISSTPAEIRGHAYTASNFPPPGGVWNGLTMGDYISEKSGSPTGLVVDPGNNQVTLRWNAPLNTGGAEIDHYIIYMNGTDVAHVEGTMKTITGLTNGVSYDFAVAAHTVAGTGTMGESVSATPRAPLTLVLPPNAPTDLTATPGDGQVQLLWTAPNDDGGSPITGYNLSWALTVGGPYTSSVVDGTSYLHEGLENGRTYYYKVAAINAMGESEMTEVASATPLATIQLPSAPNKLDASVNDGTVSLTWTSPADGSQISSYKIYRGTSPATIGLLTSISGTSFLDTNVLSNQTYYYQVSAVSAAGEGERSADVSVTVPASSDNGQDHSRPFLDTLEGQVAIVGLIAVAGVGAVTYAVWRRRRP